MSIYESAVYSLQPSPTRQICWIVQFDTSGKFHSIRTDVFRFQNGAEFLAFWRMVTGDAVAARGTQ